MLLWTLIKTLCVDPAQECHILCKTHGGTWQKINHRALKPAAVAVFITELLHAAYKNNHGVYSTWMPALLNINTICVHIISMLIRSISTDTVSCHSIVMLIKQMKGWGDESDIQVLNNTLLKKKRSQQNTHKVQLCHRQADSLSGPGWCCCNFVSSH